MSFHVGQHVVCVDDVWHDIDPLHPNPDDLIDRPIAGHVYTVREIIRSVADASIRLHEIRNEPLYYADGYNEAAFFCCRFRPLNESRLDIFRAHLAPLTKVPA